MTNISQLRTRALLTLFALLALPTPGHTRSVPADTTSRAVCSSIIDFGHGNLTGNAADFARAAELVGAAPRRSHLIRRASEEARLPICATPNRIPWASTLQPYTPESDPSFYLVKPALRLARNTAYPDDRNNGALWAGRGLGAELTGGLAFSWGALSGAFLPSFLYQENRGFQTITSVRPPGYSPHLYPWSPGAIDWPQRFGERHHHTFHPGQSYLQLSRRGFALTLSTENLWWGPAQQNPLLLGNTAPGFAHLALGTARPHDLRIGALEARVVWGRLEESPYFDGEVKNDTRLFAGLIAALQPYALPGLHLGFARAHILELDDLAAHRRILAPFWSMGGGDEAGGEHPGYQLVSLFGRWAFPDAGFEAYAEWASRARWSDLSDFIREPGRDQAFLVGFQYVVPAGPRWVRAYGEVVQLGGSPKLPREGGPHSFYTDPRIRQGHTHRGQLLGAAIGPGSDAQILGIDLFTSWGRTGLFAERTRRDEDAYFTIWTRYYGRSAHDIALRGGLRQLFFLGDYSVGWTLSYEGRRNRNFIGLDGANWDLLHERNWGLQLELGWRPGAARSSFRPAIISARSGSN
jgi:hypothetical protein